MIDDELFEFTERALESVRFVVRREVGEDLAHRMRAERRVFDATTQRIGWEFAAQVMAERLPPQTVKVRIGYEHPEAIGERAWTTDLRFATPWHFWLARHRQRWWARLLRLHKCRLRHTEVPVPYVTVAPVRCDHVATVNIHDRWIYPNPPVDVGKRLGYSVLHHNRTDTRVSYLRGETDPWS